MALLNNHPPREGQYTAKAHETQTQKAQEQVEAGGYAKVLYVVDDAPTGLGAVTRRVETDLYQLHYTTSQ